MTAAWEGHYCEADVDGCLENACIDGVECIDVPAPGEGMECGPCPVGYTDDGNKCAGIFVTELVCVTSVHAMV